MTLWFLFLFSFNLPKSIPSNLVPHFLCLFFFGPSYNWKLHALVQNIDSRAAVSNSPNWKDSKDDEKIANVSGSRELANVLILNRATTDTDAVSFTVKDIVLWQPPPPPRAGSHSQNSKENASRYRIGSWRWLYAIHGMESLKRALIGWIGKWQICSGSRRIRKLRSSLLQTLFLFWHRYLFGGSSTRCKVF